MNNEQRINERKGEFKFFIQREHIGSSSYSMSTYSEHKTKQPFEAMTSAVDQKQTVFVRERNDKPHVVENDDQLEYVVPASGYVLLSDS